MYSILRRLNIYSLIFKRCVFLLKFHDVPIFYRFFYILNINLDFEEIYKYNSQKFSIEAALRIAYALNPCCGEID